MWVPEPCGYGETASLSVLTLVEMYLSSIMIVVNKPWWSWYPLQLFTNRNTDVFIIQHNWHKCLVILFMLIPAATLWALLDHKKVLDLFN